MCWSPRTSGSAYSNRARPVQIRVATIDYKITIASTRFLVFLMIRRNRIETTPHVPRGDCAPRLPIRRYFAGFTARHGFAAEIVDADSLDQAEVVEWQHVRARQVEDQEHLRRPASDAANLREIRDDRLVFHRGPL